MPRRKRAKGPPASRTAPTKPVPRIFYEVPRDQHHVIESYLSRQHLDYEHFHASFINHGIRLTQRLKGPHYIISEKDRDDQAILTILRESPTRPERYIEALELFHKRGGLRGDQILRGYIKTTSFAEHLKGQNELRRVVFTREERAQLKQARLAAMPALAQAGLQEMDSIMWDTTPLREAVEEVEKETEDEESTKGQFTLAIRSKPQDTEDSPGL